MQAAEEGGVIGVYLLDAARCNAASSGLYQCCFQHGTFCCTPCLLQCSNLRMSDELHNCLSTISPTLQAAVAEAAFMTGLERNSPTVRMASYAPLLVNTHNRAWGPDAIVFNTRKAYGIPSYYVQQMFAENMGIAYASSNLKITFGDIHSVFTAASTTCLDSACKQIAIKVGVPWPHEPAVLLVLLLNS